MGHSKFLSVLGGLAVGADCLSATPRGRYSWMRHRRPAKPNSPASICGAIHCRRVRSRFGTLRYRSEEPINGGSIGFLADSKTVVIGVPGSHRLQLMDASTGKVVREISTGDIAIQKIKVLPKGESIAVTASFPKRPTAQSPQSSAF